MVESPDNSNNIYSIHAVGTRVGKYGDQHMLFQIEGPRIHGERPFRQWDAKLFLWKGCSHKPSERENDDLSRNRRNVELILAITEKLVDKGQEDAGD